MSIFPIQFKQEISSRRKKYQNTETNDWGEAFSGLLHTLARQPPGSLKGAQSGHQSELELTLNPQINKNVKANKNGFRHEVERGLFSF